MSIVSAWVVPHAPVLVPGLSRRAEEAGDPPRVDVSGAEVVIVASPHGGATGVYPRAAGSLDGFGVPGVARSVVADEDAAAALAEEWGKPLLDVPLDHGALVPLWWLPEDVPTVACTFGEVTGPAPPYDHAEVAAEASRLAEAVGRVAERRAVAFLASAHLSAGLTPGAPLAEVAGAMTFDRRVLDALERDPSELLAIPPDQWAAAGACGTGPLLTLAGVWGSPLRVTSYSHPFGVGYVTARATA